MNGVRDAVVVDVNALAPHLERELGARARQMQPRRLRLRLLEHRFEPIARGVENHRELGSSVAKADRYGSAKMISEASKVTELVLLFGAEGVGYAHDPM